MKQSEIYLILFALGMPMLMAGLPSQQLMSEHVLFGQFVYVILTCVFLYLGVHANQSSRKWEVSSTMVASCAVILIGFSCAVIPSIIKGIVSVQWKPTQAKLLSVTYEHFNYLKNGMGDITHVKYRYYFSGNSFENSRIQYGYSDGQLNSNFREGDITVYVNPDNPSESVVIPGYFSGNYFIIVQGLILFSCMVASSIEFSKPKPL